MVVSKTTAIANFSYSSAGIHDQEQALLFNKHINHIPEHLPVNMLPLVQHSFSEKLPSRTLAGIR